MSSFAKNAGDIEDEPGFAKFLDFLAEDSRRHPEILGDIGELMADDGDLYDGVLVDES